MADRPRIRDVATLAGTSVSTVSNLLNGRPDRMRPETVQRIEAAISQLGYRPSWTARHLKTGFVPMLGLLVPSVANPSHGAMARAVEVAAEERGLQVVLGNSLRDPERERRYGSEFLDLGIRGMIVGSSPLDPRSLRRSHGSRPDARRLRPDGDAATASISPSTASASTIAMPAISPPAT